MQRLKQGDHVVIIYDPINTEYDDTDAKILRVIPDYQGDAIEVERWDGTIQKYHEGCILRAQDKYLFEGLPQICDCGKDKHGFGGKHLSFCPKA